MLIYHQRGHNVFLDAPPDTMVCHAIPQAYVGQWLRREPDDVTIQQLLAFPGDNVCEQDAIGCTLSVAWPPEQATCI